MEDNPHKQKRKPISSGAREKTHVSRDMYERRPLKTVSLTPPEYQIDPQILLESYIEKEVRLAGIVNSIPLSLDPTNRTNVLRIIDRGKHEQVIPWSVNYEHDAIFCLSCHNIKITRRDGEELLLRVAIHEVAATCYIRDDGQHILAIQFAVSNDVLIKPQEDLCNLAVPYCDTKACAEELCSLIGQCFQLVYTEATIEFFDHRLLEATQALSVSSSNITTTTRSGWSDNSNSNRSTPRSGRNKMSFMSQSQHNLDYNATSNSRDSRSLPQAVNRRKTSGSSETELSAQAKELLQQYMQMLHSKLSASELHEFARLLKASSSSMPFSDFCDKLYELYGSERRHLLAGMRPFIPEKNSSQFETFLSRIGVNGNARDSPGRNS